MRGRKTGQQNGPYVKLNKEENVTSAKDKSVHDLIHHVYTFIVINTKLISFRT